MWRAALIAGLVMLSVAFAFGDYKEAFAPDIDSPPIEYGTRPTTDAISRLNLQIQQGKVHLKFDDQQGYLRSVLEALDVPIQSQLAVFSKTSFQMYRISPSNPRSLYFNDSVAVGWVRGGPIVELAAEDPKQGVIFYTLDQKPAQQPQFVRHDDTCLACHESTAAAGVPGMLVRSVFPSPSGMPLEELGGYVTDDRSPFAQRWGGWYVTGMTGSMRHIHIHCDTQALVRSDAGGTSSEPDAYPLMLLRRAAAGLCPGAHTRLPHRRRDACFAITVVRPSPRSSRFAGIAARARLGRARRACGSPNTFICWLSYGSSTARCS